MIKHGSRSSDVLLPACASKLSRAAIDQRHSIVAPRSWQNWLPASCQSMRVSVLSWIDLSMHSDDRRLVSMGRVARTHSH